MDTRRKSIIVRLFRFLPSSAPNEREISKRASQHGEWLSSLHVLQTYRTHREARYEKNKSLFRVFYGYVYLEHNNKLNY